MNATDNRSIKVLAVDVSLLMKIILRILEVTSEIFGMNHIAIQPNLTDHIVVLD